MTDLLIDSPKWTLSIDGEVFIAHTPGRPFAEAVRREKHYTQNRGTTTTEETEVERVPLTRAAQDGEGAILLTGGSHTLRIGIREIPGGAELSFGGEEGWAYDFAMPANKDEAVFGGGEQYRQINLRGEKVVNFVSEHITAKTVLEKGFRPASRYREKNHSEIGTYAPMPHFVTDRGKLISFWTDSDGISDFTANDRFVFSFDACPSKLTLLKGRSFRELALRCAEMIPNRQYLPDWCFDGMILGAQGGREMVMNKVASMLDAGARVSAVWCQEWCGENITMMGKQVYWNWETDEKLYPDLPGMIRELREKGVRFLGYINPYLVKDSRLYNICHDLGYLIRKKDGDIYHIRSTTFDAGMLDLTNPEVVRFIKTELIGKNMLGIGMSGWMADFGEYLPVDCELFDGDPGVLHNRWPVLWAKINREAIEEYAEEHEEISPEDILFFSRSGYTGIQSYAPVMWNGDQHTDFTRDYGMPCVMPATFSLGFCGVTMVHCDIGGFFTFGKMARNNEVLIRWMEMSTFSLLMRSHESLRPWVNTQPYWKKALPYSAFLTNVHVKLKPYLQHCAEEAQKGIPAIRPDFWEAMDYLKMHSPYAYFLGDDLFVAPITKTGSVRRRFFLPEGKWIHFWTGEPYEGGRNVIIEAPLGKIPVLYREESRFAAVFREAADTKIQYLEDKERDKK